MELIEKLLLLRELPVDLDVNWLLQHYFIDVILYNIDLCVTFYDMPDGPSLKYINIINLEKMIKDITIKPKQVSIKPFINDDIDNTNYIMDIMKNKLIKLDGINVYMSSGIDSVICFNIYIYR